ncbi:iron ABC transporter permease [Allobranchiibius sp. CTAmp26]|uniref:ABC transporter permease n=1 Tax=Allobranchiibius sp. CTAmp26 TaxID=2815214 RepID=UPI001AA14299|nr:iron ABC transporter permease [Allobranchiibius sp. CTAmp26]MBO1753981.1 iron ABC transporter permease [Allobranchiibius sp. CTAmp26]
MRVNGLGRWWPAAVALVPLAFLGVFFVLPVAGMLARGLHPDGHWALADAARVFGRPRERRVVLFTLGIATLGTAVTTVLGLPVAYALYRLRIPGAGVLRALVATPFVLPTVVVGVAFRTLLVSSGPLGFLGLDGTWVAIALALVFFNLSVVVRTVGSAWAALDPRPQEAAAALGAGPVRVFRTVTLPALAPTILSAVTIVFLFCATAFGVVLTMGGLRYSTIETEIYQQTTDVLDLRTAAVLSIAQFVVVVLLLVVVERARSGVRPQPAGAGVGRRRRPARQDLPVLAVTAAVVIFLVLPLASLVARSLHADGGWSLQNYRRLGTAGDGGALLVPVGDAIASSWRIAVDATLLSVILGLAVAVTVAHRPNGRSGRPRRLAVLDAVFMLPLGISAVTVGFGFIVTLNRPPLDLRDSQILIPIAQALVALPLVVRTVAPALVGIDDRQRQAAASLGAGRWQVVRTVDLPVVWRPLLAATGFAFAVSLGEFGATSFLARPDHPTLPVVIYQLIGHPGGDNFGMALAASVLLALMTAAVMAGVESLRVGSVGRF